MLWIDPATGETRAHGTIQLERSESILFGPFITQGDRVWCCFAYAPANGASTAENEIRIIELSPDKPALPGEGS